MARVIEDEAGAGSGSSVGGSAGGASATSPSIHTAHTHTHSVKKLMTNMNSMMRARTSLGCREGVMGIPIVQNVPVGIPILQISDRDPLRVSRPGALKR